jgi:MFS family permease
MLAGTLPALLVFFIMFAVPESSRWLDAARSAPLNPLREVFSPSLRRTTCLAMAFASIALIGTWGSVQWLPAWADQLAGGINPSAKADTQILVALGAIVGAWGAPLIGARLGRRPAYAVFCLVSFVVCGGMFRFVHEFAGGFLAMSFLIGATTASFYGLFPLYFPELFPTSVRATGQGVCFNSGRILAAVGALTQGQLVGYFNGSFALAGALITLIYLPGIALVWLAPETKGKPLPP